MRIIFLSSYILCSFSIVVCAEGLKGGTDLENIPTTGWNHVTTDRLKLTVSRRFADNKQRYLAVNCGGKNNGTYEEDNNEWIYGQTRIYRNQIFSTNDSDLPSQVKEHFLRSYRSGVNSSTWGYSIPMKRLGYYDCYLYFAETNEVHFSNGSRVFNVTIMDQNLSRLDVYREAGGAFKPLSKKFENLMVEDHLEIEFIPESGDAFLSAIECMIKKSPSVGPKQNSASRGAGIGACLPVNCKFHEYFDPKSCRCQSRLNCDGRVRIRKEYREIDSNQREKFVRAVKKVNQRGDWEKLSQIHSLYAREIHGKEHFFPWHSAFIFIMESMLIEEEPSLHGLPFWDWTFGEKLSENYIWSADYIGSAMNGPLPDGPFQDFSVNGSLIQRQLRRDYNVSSVEEIRATLVNPLLLPFWNSSSSVCVSRSLELHHDILHVAVGGDMVSLHSPSDPLFYLHHSFLEMWWTNLWPLHKGFDRSLLYDEVIRDFSSELRYDYLGNVTLKEIIENTRCVQYLTSNSSKLLLKIPMDDGPSEARSPSNSEKGRDSDPVSLVSASNYSFISAEQVNSIATFSGKSTEEVEWEAKTIRTQLDLIVQ